MRGEKEVLTEFTEGTGCHSEKSIRLLTARTLYHRFLSSALLSQDKRGAQAHPYNTLDPVWLLVQINHTLEHLWNLVEHSYGKEVSVTPSY